MKIAYYIYILNIPTKLNSSTGSAESYKVVMPKDSFFGDMPALDVGAYCIGIYRICRHRMLRRECIFAERPNITHTILRNCKAQSNE